PAGGRAPPARRIVSCRAEPLPGPPACSFHGGNHLSPVGPLLQEVRTGRAAHVGAPAEKVGKRHTSVSTPMLLAVPATTFIASSTSRAFRSGIFASAIWRTWS